MSEYQYCEFQVIDLPLFFLPNHLTRTTPPRDASKGSRHALVKSNIEMKIENYGRVTSGERKRVAAVSNSIFRWMAASCRRSIELYFSVKGRPFL